MLQPAQGTHLVLASLEKDSVSLRLFHLNSLSPRPMTTPARSEDFQNHVPSQTGWVGVGAGRRCPLLLGGKTLCLFNYYLYCGKIHIS